MRSELNQYELIESYLSGSLSKEQNALFQNQLSESSELQEQLEFQQLAIQATKRIALRNEIANTTGKSGGGLSTTIITGAVIALIALTSAVAFLGSDDPKESKSEKKEVLKDTDCVTDSKTSIVNDEVLDTVVEEASKPNSYITYSYDEDLTTWLPMKKQVFTVDPAIGATVEGEDGTLVIIPSDAFVDNNNRVIEGNVQFELVEALKWEDMLAYNLTTTNNGKALSTGGMVRVQPYFNGKKVKINPERPVYIEILTDDFDPDMQAWEGEVENGNINWTNPAPLKRHLTKVDLALLDFLPEGFDDEVESNLPYKNHKVLTEVLVDSLYYALSNNTTVAGANPVSRASRDTVVNSASFVVQLNSPLLPAPIVDTLGTDSTTSVDPVLFKGFPTNNNRVALASSNTGSFSQANMEYCYLDPLSIQTIRTDKFENSFVATKEFEARVDAIHKLPNAQQVFDLYIANIGEDMYKTDEKVVEILSGEDKLIFEQFAGEMATNIEGSIYDEQLQKYYKTKRKVLASVQKRRKDLYRNKTVAELNKLKKAIQVKKSKPSKSSSRSKRAAKISPAPVSPVSAVTSVASQRSYATPWFRSAWVNIDSYIHLLSKGTPFDVDITAENIDGDTKMYQSNGYLNTILTLNFVNGKAKAKFPDPKLKESQRMGNSFCIGVSKNDEKIFYADRNYNPYTTPAVNLIWKEVSEDELYANFKAISPLTSLIGKEMQREEQRIAKALAVKLKQEELRKKREAEEKIRLEKLAALQEKIRKEQEFMSSLKAYISKCDCDDENKSIPATRVVEEAVILPKKKLQKKEVQEEEFDSTRKDRKIDRKKKRKNKD